MPVPGRRISQATTQVFPSPDDHWRAVVAGRILRARGSGDHKQSVAQTTGWLRNSDDAGYDAIELTEAIIPCHD